MVAFLSDMELFLFLIPITVDSCILKLNSEQSYQVPKEYRFIDKRL